MRILFVSSGNSKSGISPIIKNQGKSLEMLGHELSYFTIQGKGIKGYVKSIFALRKYLKKNNFNIIHAHYSLSAFVASLSGAKSLVVSLMGSDVKATKFMTYLIKLFAFLSWDSVIVKSKDMKDSLGLTDIYIIPNGVNFERFKPIDKAASFYATKWNPEKKHILFAANPERPVKNFKLAQDALDLLADSNVELHSLANIPNELVPYYYNAADVVLLTSLWEGSPNVVKEAMACNAKVVSTLVGDVNEIMDGVAGCSLVSFIPRDVSEKLKIALANNVLANGRNRLIELELSSINVAQKITSVYLKALKR